MSSGAGRAFHRFPTDLRNGVGTRVREAGGAYAVDFDLSGLTQASQTPAGALVPVYTPGSTTPPVLVPITSGGGSSGGVVSATAAEAIGGHKILYARPDGSGVAAASATDISQAGKIVGMSLAAAAQGDVIQYVYFGPVDEPSWFWVPGPVYLGPIGNPTQTYPTSGFVQQIGVASSPTHINVKLESFVILA